MGSTGAAGTSEKLAGIVFAVDMLRDLRWHTPFPRLLGIGFGRSVDLMNTLAAW